MRLIRLDDPVPVKRRIVRNGKEIEVTVPMRERRFVQMINGTKLYFREFGSSRDVDKDTGQWAATGQRLPMHKRGSELIHFTVLKDSKTPYGLPRWINQLPSVLGSRKAEEFNLEFFESGGLPPVLVLVQGGYLGDTVRESLEAHLSGKAGKKHRAAVVEATASSGSLDSSGTVKVTVERFGAERQQDSMFQKYDQNTEEHVRTAFRLPPMFVGRAQDYNFATAMTGYLVAEAQVFATERFHFDEVMWRIVTTMGLKNHMFKSKPLSLVNAENQLKALEMIMTKDIAEGEDVLHAINTLTGLSLEYKKPEEVPDPLSPLGEAAVLEDPDALIADPPVMKSERAQELLVLASKWARVLGLTGDTPVSKEEEVRILSAVSSLPAHETKLINASLATVSLAAPDRDLAGLAGLCGMAAE
jgi:capsid portal protein